VELSEIAEADSKLSLRPPGEIIDWAVKRFGPYIIMGTSFGRNSGKLLDEVHSKYPWIPAIFVDPGDVPATNYAYAETIAKRMPNLVIRKYENDTPLSDADRLAIESGGAARLEVYARRKLPLIRRAADEHWAQAIMYGRRFDQLEPEERSRFRVVNQDERKLVRVYPSLYTSDNEVFQWIMDSDLMHPDGLPEGIRTNCGTH
jgi:3'-phosphoadenosine 5'-phosphosulfate sulfotransferase (PAPS reductase)/FAD synthetase